MDFFVLLFQIKDVVNFQTKIKLGESVPIQWIPLKAVGARPPNMKDVKLNVDEKGTGETKPKTFLQQYVSVRLHTFLNFPFGATYPFNCHRSLLFSYLETICVL